jgi:uncharacterized membrane protein
MNIAAVDWVHLHLALNHVPVLGTIFVAFLLAWSWARGNEQSLRLSLWLGVLLSAVAIGIKFTGDFAEESMDKKREAVEAMVESHEESADQATTGVFVLGVLSAITLFLARKGRKPPRWALAATLLAGLITFGLMVRTANLGGQIRHPEVRPASPSAA